MVKGVPLARYGIYVCNFDSTFDLRNLTYAKLKRRVLQVGRFSVFEATATQARARLFERLKRDPKLEITPLGFPWYKVSRKTKRRRTK